MYAHNLVILSQVGTFVTVFSGVLGILWKGQRRADAFISSVRDNTKATEKLTAGLESVTTQTRDNTAQIAALTSSTDHNTEAITSLGGRVTRLEEKMIQP